MKSNLFRHQGFHLAVLVLLGTLAYSNTFQVPLVLDDLESITRNESIRDLRNFLPGGSGYDFHFRRWIVYFTFALNYHFGGLSVAGYHMFNLIIHLGNGILLYTLVRRTFMTPVLAGSRLAPDAALAGLVAGLLFLLHPIQTQAVTYTVQRLASLCTFFYMLSLVLYAEARLSTVNGAPNGSRPRSSILIVVSALSAAAAMFCKEIAVTLPLSALLYELFFFQGPLRRRLIPLLPLLGTIVIIPLTMVAPGETVGTSVQEYTFTDISPMHYFLTQFRVVVTYLRLMVLPVNQNLDYDYPLYTSMLAPPVMFSFFLLVILIIFAFYLFRSASASTTGACRPERKLASFGLFWFFLTLSVESSFLPLPDLIFEHRMYLPSAGLCAAGAVGAGLLLRSVSGGTARGIVAGAAVILFGILGTATWKRNMVWMSEISLWEDTVAKSPGKVRPLYNLGTHFGDNGRPAEAVPILSKVVSLDPRHADAWHNLGRAYLLLGRSEEAVAPLRTAVGLSPKMDLATLNLSSALIMTGRAAEALPLLRNAAERSPARPDIRFNLALAYATTGDLAAALREEAELRRLDPTMADSLGEIIRRGSGGDKR